MAGESVKLNFDSLLVNHLGQFGKFQWKVISLLIPCMMFIGIQLMAYVFTTARISSRCFIPECDESDPEYSPSWILNAVPGSSVDSIQICSRYDLNTSMKINETSSCPASMFDTSIVKNCDERLVYENTDTIVYDFDLGCDEWRRTLVGTIKTVGTIFGTLIMGTMADRFGRKTVMIFNIFCAGCMGVLRSWSNSYTVFAIFEFAESFLAAGCYQCTYVLFIETVGPDYRDKAGVSVMILKSCGQWSMSLLAWLIPNWRILTLVLYGPQILIVTYYWLMPESLRWLMNKRRYDETTQIVKKIAKTNGKNLPEELYDQFKEQAKANEQARNNPKAGIDESLVKLVFREKILLKRCLVTPMWWITSVFIYQGLLINSVNDNLFGNKYLNFFLVSVVDLPGLLISMLLTKYIGRRYVLVTSFIVCGLCQISNMFITSDAVALPIYLLGKISIMVVVSVLYIYTAELYPTKYRQRLFGYSSTMGRLGGVIAPLTPALSAKIWPNLPYALFAGSAFLSASLVFITPETKGRKLPDTIEDILESEKIHTSSNEKIPKSLQQHL